MYIGAILILFWKSLAIARRASTPSHQKWLIGLSFAMYGAGFSLMWIPGEVLFPCELARQYHLHAWFHITAIVGPFLWLSMAVWERMSFRSKRPELVWGLGAPLPYVAIPIPKPKGT